MKHWQHAGTYKHKSISASVTQQTLITEPPYEKRPRANALICNIHLKTTKEVSIHKDHL